MHSNILNNFPELKDKNKRKSLYSDFSNQKTLNPINYEKNLNFWKKVILELINQGDFLKTNCKDGSAPWCFSSGKLKEALSWQDPESSSHIQAPLSLDLVIEDFIKSRELALESDYILNKINLFRASGWGEWAKNYIMELVGFSNYLVLSQDSMLLAVGVLNEVTDMVLNYFVENACHNPMTDSLIEFDVFLSKICCPSTYDSRFASIDWIHLTGKPLNVFIKALQEKGALISSEENEMVIKLPSPESIRNESSSQALPFNEIDKGVLSLRRSLSQLSSKADQIEDQIISLRKQIQVHLKANRQSQALHCLKESKQKEATLQKTQQYIVNLNVIYNKIEETDSERLALQAYQHGSTALKALLADLDIDDVQQTMDDVRDVLEDHYEIQQALGESIGAASSDELDKELEAELSQMIEEQKSTSNTSETDDLIGELEKLSIAQSIPNSEKQSTLKLENRQLQPEGI